MKIYEIKKHHDYEFTVYLESRIVSKMQNWMLCQPEVLYSDDAKSFLMVDLTPRCEKKDIDDFFKRLEDEIKKQS